MHNVHITQILFQKRSRPGGLGAVPKRVSWTHKWQAAGMTSQSNIRRKRSTPAALTRAVIVRSVASSTAIETGQRIASLERTLLDNTSKFRGLKLAE